jgi:hypothetical protein
MVARGRAVSVQQGPDTRLRAVGHNLPKKVESGGVSQVVEGYRLIGQVANQDDKEPEQSLLCRYLGLREAGTDEDGHEAKSLYATFSPVSQSCSSGF